MSPVRSQPSAKVVREASGLFQYPATTFAPRISSSPTPVAGSASSTARSTVGTANPTESACVPAYSCGRNVDTDDVSVSPKPLPTRALPNADLIRPTSDGAIGAPPYVASSTLDRSNSPTFGCVSAYQKIAGTVVTTVMRSSTIALRKRCTSKVGMTMVVPPSASVGSSCELQPVTWNNGTDTRLRIGSPSRGNRMRMTFSMFVTKFSFVVIAPLGKPVVPDV